MRNLNELINLLRETCGSLYPDRELDSIAFLIAEHVTGRSRTELVINREEGFTKEEGERIREKVRRLGENEPIQYILGETEFYGLKIKVEPGVLIPRGETEELVEWILLKEEGERRKEKGERRKEEVLRVVDIGCGSGAIAVALAKHLPDAQIWAADISPQALNLTLHNAQLNNVTINPLLLDILTPSPTFPLSPSPTYSLIVSNPPYIPESERSSMALHVAGREPDLALFVPDEDPLLFYRALAEFAKRNLTPDGELFVEIHDRYGKEVVALFSNYFSTVELRQDIHGKDRMVRAYNG